MRTDPRRILSREDCEAIYARVCAFAKQGIEGGDTGVRIGSWWQGELRWGRNRVTLASDRRDVSIEVRRVIQVGSWASVTTNQIDDVSLEAAVRAAERKARWQSSIGGGGGHPKLPEYKPADQAIWSDATYNLTTEARSEVARALVDPAEAKEMLSAGYIEVRAGAMMECGTELPEQRPPGGYAFWEQPYVRWTQAQCSMSVRNKAGTGSGWAGMSSYDWGRISPSALAEQALRKCLKSEAPVALEPGRYTLILEPQAVADLMEPLLESLGHRWDSEVDRSNVWYWRRAGGRGASKLGLKVMDDRITISHDPADSQLGIIMDQTDTPGPVTWVERGVLTKLGYDFPYGAWHLDGQYSARGAIGYRMSGGATSVEEMIRTTQRGLLVTRFSNVRVLDKQSYLCTGLTRDGLWLIENGQLTKAVKNFRFTESPLFALNSLEQLGEPVPVFRPTKQEGGQLTPAVVPPLKVRDFSFTAMVDAV